MRPVTPCSPGRHGGSLPVLVLLALTAGQLQAAGSWIAEAPGLAVSLAGRETSSAALEPGDPPPEGATLTSVSWRYRVPSGRALEARLCHPAGCVTLTGGRGTTRALAGLPAEAPLTFRFSLPRGERPLRVGGLQVIVNHR